jgi:hypothetical protein
VLEDRHTPGRFDHPLPIGRLPMIVHWWHGRVITHRKKAEQELCAYRRPEFRITVVSLDALRSPCIAFCVHDRGSDSCYASNANAGPTAIGGGGYSEAAMSLSNRFQRVR